MTANDSKIYLAYLNKLVDQCNNTYHHSIGEKPIDDDYSVLTKKLTRILKLLSLKLFRESQLLSIRMFSVKLTLEIVQEKYFLWILF